jgi:hypothetical protein
MTHTHVGCRAQVGHRHSGARLWGHRLPREGENHALNGGPEVFTALCGTVVRAQVEDEFGFRREGGANNVQPVAAGRQVTCKRCRRLLEQAAKATQ